VYVSKGLLCSAPHCAKGIKEKGRKSSGINFESGHRSGARIENITIIITIISFLFVVHGREEGESLRIRNMKREPGISQPLPQLSSHLSCERN
jgi:hypothetical protein